MASAAGLAVSVVGAAAALVLGIVDLRRNRAEEAAERDPVPDERHGPDGVHSHGHVWHH